MSFVVNWTKEAEFTLNDNIEYLSNSWDLLTISNFIDRVDEVIANIKSNPRLYQIFRKEDVVYKCVVNKHITLYYKIVNDSRIDLITFWNIHRDPSTLTL